MYKTDISCCKTQVIQIVNCVKRLKELSTFVYRADPVNFRGMVQFPKSLIWGRDIFFVEGEGWGWRGIHGHMDFGLKMGQVRGSLLVILSNKKVRYALQKGLLHSWLHMACYLKNRSIATFFFPTVIKIVSLSNCDHCSLIIYIAIQRRQYLS